MSSDGSPEFSGNPIRGGGFIPPPQRRTPSPVSLDGGHSSGGGSGGVGAPLTHRHHSAPAQFGGQNDANRDQSLQMQRRPSPPLPHQYHSRSHSPVESPNAMGGWMSHASGSSVGSQPPSRGESPRFGFGARSFTPPYGNYMNLEEKVIASGQHQHPQHIHGQQQQHHGGGGGGHDHDTISVGSGTSSRGHSPVFGAMHGPGFGPNVVPLVPPSSSIPLSISQPSLSISMPPPAARRPSVPRVTATINTSSSLSSGSGVVAVAGGSAPASPRLTSSTSSSSIGGIPVAPASPSTPRTRRLTPPAMGRSVSGTPDRHHHTTGSSGAPMGANQGLSGAGVSMPESPMHKSRFRDFYRDFWAKARSDPEAAHTFGQRSVDTFPESMQYRLCMEIADLAKRQNKIRRARKWYKQVHRLEPTAAQGWLEHAKMEEECGELIKCQRLLRMGLLHCQYNESLLVKAIKHEERLGDLEGARSILASLKEVHIDKVWRTVLEGALLEARAGQLPTARRVFKYLMKHVSWYGPVYHEACRFEEKQHEFDRAVTVVDRGLQEVPKYGPLWFTALRLYERTCQGNLTKPRDIVQRAVKAISSELVWKIHFESAQMEETAGHYDRSRAAFAESVRHCPKNLRWKAWLSGARMELRAQRCEVARQLLARALEEAPKKMRATVQLELSRLEEFVGNVSQARLILQRAQKETSCEWKVFLESVLLELRCSNIDGAIRAAESALKVIIHFVIAFSLSNSFNEPIQSMPWMHFSFDGIR
jgi:tetratricopeptide (TPR) repeat protein